MSSNVSDIFGSNVFNESVMRDRLPKEIYKKLKNASFNGEHLSLQVANVVANTMKDWAVEKGATHYTHWFQPMTGITAEKHDSFIAPAEDGKIILDFSGKELIKGEPDASSFPNGGIRSTFEARGYTAWDPTSNAFIKDGTLCIPTVFCSYSGESLDQKTPLLRSMEVLNEQSLRVLKHFKNPAKRVLSTVGAEQEYFLIDKNTYKERPDLIFSGRTLFGAMPPKGQELDDHYFGNLTERVSAYMKELDEELWKLGIYSKTKHNEVAPAQHEHAPIFTTSNISADHNQLTMEIMRKVAKRHDLVCLLHEKPFAGVNGSGKHNNWSISTDLGENLFEPTDKPEENFQFLLFLSAVIATVDRYADLLRATVASAGNDHRLGANEAPPSIISIYLGGHLSNLLDAIQTGTIKISEKQEMIEVQGTAIAPLFKDTTDRNRTSPFAFTGNKFEFRMVGSAQSISPCNIVLNTCVSEVLSEFADILDKTDNVEQEVLNIVKNTVLEHGRIIFNGNNYSSNWVTEAKNRGLPNLKRTVDAIPTLIHSKNINVFTKFNVLTEAEIYARYEIQLENYCKSINIEALCMINMVKTQILPACLKYSESVFTSYNAKIASGLNLNLENEAEYATKLTALTSNVFDSMDNLIKAHNNACKIPDYLRQSQYFSDAVLEKMEYLRADVDMLETMTDKSVWPIPKYEQIVFNV